MYNWKHQIRRIELFPHINLIFAGTAGIDLLSHAKHVIADGTFDICEEKLILTTIMAYSEGVSIPAAYLLSNSKETENYKVYLMVPYFFSV